LYNEDKEVFFIAKKGQKFGRYTKQQREEFIKGVQEGLSSSELAQKHDLPRGTVFTWKHRYLKTGTLEPKKKGRPEQPGKENYKLRYEILKKFMDSTKGGGKKN